jgi:hypothetical protein
MQQLKFWTILTAGMSTLGLTAGAQTRSEAEMQALATQFLQTTQVRRVDTPTATTTRASAEAPYAVFVPTEGAGYVVVATTEAQTPILAFSETGTFDATRVPPAMTELLWGTARQVTAHLSAADSLTAVAPLLGDIAFGQEAPYSGQCPIVDGQRTVTGCVATAMAQVMTFYRYPEQMLGEPIRFVFDSIQPAVTWIPAETKFRWDEILPVYETAYVPYSGNDVISAAHDFGATRLSTDSWYIYLDTLRMSRTEPFKGYIGTVLTTDDGTLISPVGTTFEFELPLHSYYPRYGLSIPQISTLTADMPDGAYRLYVGLKAEGSEEWLLVQQAVPNTADATPREAPYLPILKTGQQYTLNGTTHWTAYTQEQADAVALLHAACGASIEAIYGVDETMALSEDMFAALNENFGYDDGMQLIYEPDRSTAITEAELLAELQAGRPVLAGGATIDNAGHQFVIDGVRQQDGLLYFHFNWGWDGYDNGYFLLNFDHQQADGDGVNAFSYDMDYVLGLKPEDGVVAPVQCLCLSATTDAEQYAAGDNLELRPAEISNTSLRTFTGQVLAYLVDEQDDTRAYALGALEGTNVRPLTLYSLYYQELSPYRTRIPSDLPDGRYVVQLRTLEQGQATEVPVRMDEAATIQVGGSVSGIETWRVPTTQRLGQRFTTDGRRIADGTSVHGLYIQDGRLMYTR